MESRRYRHEDLFEYGCRVLERLDVPAAHARDVAGCLIKAELRGVDSHGLVRLPVYARRVQAGVVKARPDIRLISSGTAAALVDGDNGLGPVVGTRAMEAALELARSHGTGFVGVRHSNHFGPAAYYVEKAVSQGFIGVAISNAPPHMAPFGGRARFLGTNPVAIGIPAGEEDPLIFDASTSVVARGKIIMAAHTKTPIPEGWAIDPEGYPTTDPEQALAGAVLPFGGPKGSAISFIIDVLCGVMTGASFALHLNRLEDLATEQNVGHVFAAVRTDLFVPDAQFKEPNGCHPENAESVASRARDSSRAGAGRDRIRQRITNAGGGNRLARGDRRATGRARRGARRRVSVCFVSFCSEPARS